MPKADANVQFLTPCVVAGGASGFPYKVAFGGPELRFRPWNGPQSELRPTPLHHKVRVTGMCPVAGGAIQFSGMRTARSTTKPARGCAANDRGGNLKNAQEFATRKSWVVSRRRIAHVTMHGRERQPQATAAILQNLVNPVKKQSGGQRLGASDSSYGSAIRRLPGPTGGAAYFCRNRSSMFFTSSATVIGLARIISSLFLARAASSLLQSAVRKIIGIWAKSR